MSEWQDISTAPKDGTWFWGLVDHADAIHMVWHPAFDEFVSSWRRMQMAAGWSIDGQSTKDHSPDVQRPTHWMMPTLPKPVRGPMPHLPAALHRPTDEDT